MAKQPKKLDDLFHDTLKDIYYAEKKILTALPKMAKAAQNEDLKAAFDELFRVLTPGATIALIDATEPAGPLLRLVFDPILENQLALVTLYGAVAFTVWWGGRGPALC